MNHLTVARARTGTRPRLAFQHADAPPPLRQRPRRGEADDAGADDGRIDCFHHLVVKPLQVRTGRAARTPPRKRARRGPRVVAAGSPRSNLVAGSTLPVHASHKMRPLQQSNATALRVLVTGAAGRLGAAIVEAFHDAQVTAHARSSLDITDAAAVSDAVRAARPDVIVNCAAFNDVDGAESRSEERRVGKEC